MSSRLFSNWLTAYRDYTRFSESPDIFHFWTGVSVIAGALRRRVWIDQRYFQWTPNFYIVFVGPPGIVSKSTSVGTGMHLLRRIPGVHFGPQSITWQALTQSLQEAQELMPLTDDPGGDMFPMACLTVPVSELGTFLKPDDGEMIDVLVDLWDGQVGPWKRKTKTQGADTIENPWLNIIGCTTPAWLRGNFPDYMIGGGLTSRIVFVYGDTKRQLVAYPADVIESAEFTARADELVSDLLRIADLKGEYRITDEAKHWGANWYEMLWAKRPLHLASDRYSGYIARKQTHIHKLAIVLAAAQRDKLEIIADDLIVADRIVSSLENDMAKVFESIGMVDASRHAADLIATVRAYGKIEKRTLWRQFMTRLGLKDFEDALQSGVNAGYLRIATEGVTIVVYPVSEPAADVRAGD